MSASDGVTQAKGTVFFVHVMKTGGSTVQASLMGTYPANSRYPQAGVDRMLKVKASGQALLNLSQGRKSALQWVNAHLPLSTALCFREESSHPVSITLLLRDGLDRAVSHLRQVARRFEYAYSYRQLLDNPIFGDFFFSNHQTRALGIGEAGWGEWDRCFQDLFAIQPPLKDSQSPSAVTLIGETDLERAIAGLSQIDVVGLQDEFDEWWRNCRAKYGWPIKPSAPRNVATAQESVAAPPIPASILDELRQRNELDSRLYAAAREMLGR
jgi:hypothetical protein